MISPVGEILKHFVSGKQVQTECTDKEVLNSMVTPARIVATVPHDKQCQRVFQVFESPTSLNLCHSKQ